MCAGAGQGGRERALVLSRESLVPCLSTRVAWTKQLRHYLILTEEPWVEMAFHSTLLNRRARWALLLSEFAKYKVGSCGAEQDISAISVS